LKERTMDKKHALALVGGVGLGAGLMYLLDPGSGRYRRALARGRATRLLHQGGDAVRQSARDLGNRSKGFAAGFGTRLHLKRRGGLGAAVGTVGLGLLARSLTNGGGRRFLGRFGRTGRPTLEETTVAGSGQIPQVPIPHPMEEALATVGH
jgi:hypothetical protein